MSNHKLHSAKRPLALLIAMLMVVMMLPTVALAAGIDSDTALTQAISDAQNNETIALGGDITLSDGILLDSKNLTIDLNGNTLTVNNPAGAGITVNDSHTLTIKDTATGGTLEVTGSTYGVDVLYESALINDETNPAVINVYGTDGGVSSVNGGDAQVTSVTVIGDTTMDTAIRGVLVDNGPTSTKKGTVEVTGDITVTGNGTEFTVYGAMADGESEIIVGGEITVIKGGSVTPTESWYGVHASDNAVVSVEGDVTVDWNVAIQAQAGATVTVGGIATGEKGVYVHDGADTTVTVGGAVGEVERGDDERSGGEIANANAIWVAAEATDATVTVNGNVEGDRYGALNMSTTSTITVDGDVTGGVAGVYAYDGTINVTGDVTGAADAAGADAANNCGAKVANGAEVTIDGEIFADATSYVMLGSAATTADGFTAPSTKFGYLTYTEATAGTIWVATKITPDDIVLAKSDEITVETELDVDTTGTPEITLTLTAATDIPVGTPVVTGDTTLYDEVYSTFTKVLNEAPPTPIASLANHLGRWTIIGIDRSALAEAAGIDWSAYDNVWIKQTNPLLSMYAGTAGISEDSGTWTKGNAYTKDRMTATPDGVEKYYYLMIPSGDIPGTVTLDFYGDTSAITSAPTDDASLRFTLVIDCTGITHAPAEEVKETATTEQDILDALAAFDAANDGQAAETDAKMEIVLSTGITLTADLVIPANVTLILDGIELVADPDGGALTVEGNLIIRDGGKLTVKAKDVVTFAYNPTVNPALVGMTVDEDIFIDNDGALDVQAGAYVVVNEGKGIYALTGADISNAGKICNTDGTDIIDGGSGTHATLGTYAFSYVGVAPISVNDPELVNNQDGTASLIFYSATAPQLTDTISLLDRGTYTFAEAFASGLVEADMVATAQNYYRYIIKQPINEKITVIVNGIVVVNELTVEVVGVAPTAAVADVTVSGTENEAITDATVIITLTNAQFNASIDDTVVSGWFANLPTGLTATVDRLTGGNVAAEIKITGTPAATSSAAMSITIPGAAVTTAENIVVAANADAKYAIVADVPATDDFSVTINDDETAGIVGQKRTITVTETSGDITGKFLLVQISENGKVAVIAIELADDGDVTISYQTAGAEIDVWLLDDLTDVNLPEISPTVTIFAHDTTRT